MKLNTRSILSFVTLVEVTASHCLAAGSPAGPPTAQTQPADNVTTNQATLHGTVNPNRKATWAYFEFREAGSSNFTGMTLPKKIGNGHKPTQVSLNLAGLTRSTDYVFRLVATNSLGSTLGSELMLLVPPTPPPIVNSWPAYEITSTSARLFGTVHVRRPEIAQQIRMYLEWGVTTNYGNLTDSWFLLGNGSSPNPFGPGPGSDPGIFPVISGLSPETIYHFRMVASNADGMVTGADQTFQTLPLPQSQYRLSVPIFTSGAWQLQLTGPPGAQARLQESFDLSNWSDIATNTIGSQGFLLLQPPPSDATQRFFRSVSP